MPIHNQFNLFISIPYACADAFLVLERLKKASKHFLLCMPFTPFSCLCLMFCLPSPGRILHVVCFIVTLMAHLTPGQGKIAENDTGTGTLTAMTRILTEEFQKEMVSLRGVKVTQREFLGLDSNSHHRSKL